MIRVLCLCLGNICRSPLAEGILKHKIHQKGWQKHIAVDSAGTNGYHDGELADPRARQTAQKYGLNLTSRSRRICPKDYEQSDYILVMDDFNYQEVHRLAPSSVTLPEIHKIRAFDRSGSHADVADPYFGDQSGFEVTWQQLSECCDNFLIYLQEKYQFA